MPRTESEFRPNLLDRAEKITPARPITDTKSKLPEVGSDTAHGAKSLGSNGDGARLRTGQKHKVQGSFQEYPWNFHIHLYASVCAWQMRCLVESTSGCIHCSFLSRKAIQATAL